MKKVVENVYSVMYESNNDITFTEMFLVCMATFGVIFGVLFTVLTAL